MSDVYEEVTAFLDQCTRKGPNALSEMFRACSNHPKFMAAEEGFLRRQWKEARDEAEALRAGKQQAYAERNKLVAWLASIFPSTMCETDIEGWDPEWHWCIYIDTPAGQLSWHIRESELIGFAHVKRAETEWDGHTTDEKYQRVSMLVNEWELGGAG